VPALDTVKTDMTTAMKAGDRQRTQALRLLLSELQKAEKEGRDDEVAVLRRERKRRDDAAQAYRDADRAELAEQEEYEAGLISEYLPAELSDGELDAIVAEAVEATGAESPKDMGKVMGVAMGKVGGKADGKRVSAKVKEKLSA
jgi:uncharacterized protein YqeY